jgi:hypothetical protein
MDSKFLLINTLVATVPTELPNSLVLMNLQIGSLLQEKDDEASYPYTALHNLCVNVIL